MYFKIFFVKTKIQSTIFNTEILTLEKIIFWGFFHEVKPVKKIHKSTFRVKICIFFLVQFTPEKRPSSVSKSGVDFLSYCKQNLGKVLEFELFCSFEMLGENLSYKNAIKMAWDMAWVIFNFMPNRKVSNCGTFEKIFLGRFLA